MNDSQQHGRRSPDGSTSRSLVAGLRQSQADAWERLVTLYAPMIVVWCRQGQVSEQDIPDVYQDVLRTVSQSIGRFRHDRPGDTFRGWLRRITQTRVVDHFRRRQREPQAAGGTETLMWLQEFPDSPESAASLGEEIFGQVLSEALSTIRPEFHPRTWDAFWGVAVQGRTPADVGAELDMRTGTVRVAKSRVLQRLRRELGDLPDCSDDSAGSK